LKINGCSWPYVLFKRDVLYIHHPHALLSFFPS
jgi:hypothetical protein